MRSGRSRTHSTEASASIPCAVMFSDGPPASQRSACGSQSPTMPWLATRAAFSIALRRSPARSACRKRSGCCKSYANIAACSPASGSSRRQAAVALLDGSDAERVVEDECKGGGNPEGAYIEAHAEKAGIEEARAQARRRARRAREIHAAGAQRAHHAGQLRDDQ